MKLFNVIGETVSEGSICELYVAKTKEDAMDRFEKEFEDTFFHYIDAIEIEEVDGYKIILGKDTTSYMNLSELVSKINCRNCRFDIYVYPSQESVVCEHCGTHNNLRVEFDKDKFCLDCCNYNIGDGIEDLEYCKECKINEKNRI